MKAIVIFQAIFIITTKLENLHLHVCNRVNTQLQTGKFSSNIYSGKSYTLYMLPKHSLSKIYKSHSQTKNRAGVQTDIAHNLTQRKWRSTLLVIITSPSKENKES